MATKKHIEKEIGKTKIARPVFGGLANGGFGMNAIKGETPKYTLSVDVPQMESDMIGCVLINNIEYVRKDK